MKKTLIIGGGLAGLSAAVDLLEKGYQVDIYETTRNLGGRARSFYYPEQDQLVDNGQHLLMGCYDCTIDFLKKIDALENFNFQKQLQTNFVDSTGKVHSLKAVSGIYPLNLLIAVLRYNFLSLSEKLKLAKFFVKLIFTNPAKLEGISVLEWLHSNSQNANIISGLWHLLAISALNVNLDKAPASLFARTLKQMFLRGNKSATLVIPAKSLTEAFCNPAEKFISKHKGRIIRGRRITGIEIDNRNVITVKAGSKVLEKYDHIISAVPPNILTRLLPGKNNKLLNEIKYSPIISVNIWLKKNPFKEKFYGLIDSEVHWLFNHNKFVSLVISSAENVMKLTKEELTKFCNSELEKYFPDYKSEFMFDVKIIKEKKATVVLDFEAERIRKEINYDLNDFYFCGDWTNTGLPATIESAIKSGKLAAEKIINKTV